MVTYTQYKRINEVSTQRRAEMLQRLNDGLDELKRDDLSKEMREEMVDTIKSRLDSEARIADIDREYEYVHGRLFGGRTIAGVCLLGTAIGVGIVRILRHKMK